MIFVSRYILKWHALGTLNQHPLKEMELILYQGQIVIYVKVNPGAVDQVAENLLRLFHRSAHARILQSLGRITEGVPDAQDHHCFPSPRTDS